MFIVPCPQPTALLANRGAAAFAGVSGSRAGTTPQTGDCGKKQVLQHCGSNYKLAPPQLTQAELLVKDEEGK